MSDDQENMIFVGNVNSRVRNEDLREFFEKVGPVKDAFVVKDKFSHRPKGCAYVKFTNYEDYRKAFELTDQELMGNKIRVLENKRPVDKRLNEHKYSIRDRDYSPERISPRYPRPDSPDPYRRSPERNSRYSDRYSRGSPSFARESSDDLRDKIVSELSHDPHLLRDCLLEAMRRASDVLLEDIAEDINALSRRRREERQNDEFSDRRRRE